MKNFNASFTEAASKEARIERFNTNCNIVAREFKNLQKLINTFLEIEYNKANIDLMKAQLVEFDNQAGRFLVPAKEAFTVAEEIQNAGEFTEDIICVCGMISLLNLQVLAILSSADKFIKKPNKKSLTEIKEVAKDINDIFEAA